MKVTISINKMISLNLCCSIIQQYFQRNCWFTIEQIKVSRYTIQDDSDPRSRLIATRRPKEGLLLVSVKSYKYRILINDSIRPCPGSAQISPRMDKTYEDVLSYYKKKNYFIATILLPNINFLIYVKLLICASSKRFPWVNYCNKY